MMSATVSLKKPSRPPPPPPIDDSSRLLHQRYSSFNHNFHRPSHSSSHFNSFTLGHHNNNNNNNNNSSSNNNSNSNTGFHSHHPTTSSPTGSSSFSTLHSGSRINSNSNLGQAHFSHRRANSKSDYIRISECHSGIPESDSLAASNSKRHHQQTGRPNGLKSRTSTSFSSTLKPCTSNFAHANHQKSRSLTDNHFGSSSYLYLDLPPSQTGAKNPTPSARITSYEYKSLDFSKTDALSKLRVERTSGRAR